MLTEIFRTIEIYCGVQTPKPLAPYLIKQSVKTQQKLNKIDNQ